MCYDSPGKKQDNTDKVPPPPPPPPQLVFPIASTKVGKPYSIAEHCVVSPDIACRELIQNALDAHASLQDERPCKVIFKIAKLKTEEIPGYACYRDALEKALKSWRKNDSVASYLKLIHRSFVRRELEVLYVVDNGKGFDERGLEAVMAEGSPDKQEGSTGSFGVGHLTSYGMSDLRYICYASKRRDGALLATGHAILSSHDSDGELRSNNGYYVQDYQARFDDPYVFGAPEQIPAFLRRELDQMESPSGSIVAVLGFNRFHQGAGGKTHGKRELHELIREAVAENFAIAIWANHLEVEVCDTTQGDLETLETILPHKVDQRRIEEFLEYMARPETGTKEQTRKAQQTLDSIKTYRDPSESGRLPGDFQDCQIFLRNRARAHNVSVWRNGMLITRKHRGLAKNQFDNKKPFDAVVMLNGKEHPRDAHDIVKKAETPMHDRIQENRLEDEDEKQTLKSWLSEVRSWISERAEESGGESADLEDEIVLDGGNTIKDKPAMPIGSGTEEEGDDDSSDPHEPVGGKGTGPRRQARRIQRKFLSAKTQGRPLANNRYRIRIRPESRIERGILRVIVDSGQDPSCRGVIQDTPLIVRSAKSPQPDGRIYPIKEGLVQLDDLREDESVVVDLVFDNPPKDLNQVSLGCLLESREKE